MKSIIYGLSLIGVVTAQSVIGISTVPRPTPIINNGAGAPPSAPTQPPADFYQEMPYAAYQSGGYRSLDCGYGYSKQADGSCAALSWVRSQMCPP